MVEKRREVGGDQSEFLADCPAEDVDTAELINRCFV